MNVFGRTIALALKRATDYLSPISADRTWGPLIRETYTGAWQQNAEPLSISTAVTNPTVYACITTIASDIAKMRWYLAEKKDDIWTEIESPAYSPVLKTPNRYQTRMQFIEWWLTSLLCEGNTYVLKERDRRNIVVAMYVLDPSLVDPLIAPDGSVFYELKQDYLNGLPETRVTVPADEIMHDRINPLFHPLVGLSPLTASWASANQGLTIQASSSSTFTNLARPGGILLSPQPISQDTADRIKEKWQTGFTGTNAAKVAVLGGGMTYVPVTQTNANDTQLIEQLNWTDERICSAFHMPRYKVGVGSDPTHNNGEIYNQLYYDAALHPRVKAIELLMGAGLNTTPYGVKFQESDLIRMSASARMEVAERGVKSGIFKPNEARRDFNLPPVDGGDTPYLQVQNYSLGALDERDSNSPPPASPQANTRPSDVSPQSADAGDETKALIASLRRQSLHARVTSWNAGL